MVGSIVVVGVLTRCTLIHFVCDLKVVWIKVQCCLIWELMLNDFKLDHKQPQKQAETFVEGKVKVQLITVSR